jgi:molybdopterin-synthase adenylyltransferase
MQDEELLRYSRHILLDDIGIEGQERILGSHALVIGAGGLGSPVAMYLAGAGVGTITVTAPTPSGSPRWSRCSTPCRLSTRW